MRHFPLRPGQHAVIRIALPYVYALAEAFDPLSGLQPNVRYGDLVYRLWNAQATLDSLMGTSVFANSLRSCRESAGRLRDALKHVTENPNPDLERILGPSEIIPITYAAEQFKTALLAEIGVLPSYFVTQKESFDTLSLLDRPGILFPPDIRDKVPEAVFDISEAGKALAFELPTACGFHVFRATESVLRRYYSHVTGGKPHPKVRNIAVYINAMRQSKCGDEKVLAALDQLSKLHRNPLSHPDAALTLEEAISTVGIARSAVAAMLAVLPSTPQTTSTAPVQVP
jgi:hypothetical protein